MPSVFLPNIDRAPRRATAEPRPVDRPSARRHDELVDRVRASGKLFSLAGEPWHVKGLTYGPFKPNSAGEFLPERGRLIADFAHARAIGANALRVYQVPSTLVLDEAQRHGLRVMVDVPWEKHRCF